MASTPNGRDGARPSAVAVGLSGDGTLVEFVNSDRLQASRVTADELIGRSEVLGEVKIRRDAVREIKFSPTSPN